MTRPDLKIGDTVWVLDLNRRVYRSDKSGPIYSEHFRAVQVVSETRASWMLSNGLKVKKNGELLNLQPGQRSVFFSRKEVEDEIYLHDNSYRIGEKVQGIKDVELLKRIAELVGYVPKAGSND